MEVVSGRDQASKRQGGRIIGAFLSGQRLDLDAFPFPFERRKHAESDDPSREHSFGNRLIFGVTQSLVITILRLFLDKHGINIQSARIMTNVSCA